MRERFFPSSVQDPTVWTDNLEFAARILPDDSLTRRSAQAPWRVARPSAAGRLAEFFPAASPLFRSSEGGEGAASTLVVLENTSESQFDQMIRILRSGQALPAPLVCIAGAGDAFHGYKGRGWAALEGNLHLSVYWSPRRNIPGYGAGLLALGALACADAVDELVGKPGVAAIKWVNDVVVGRKKIAGVLAWGQTEGSRLDSIVLGIGLNVEATPIGIEDAAVEGAIAVRELNPAVDLKMAVAALLDRLAALYTVFESGEIGQLVARYRARSVALGRQIRWIADIATRGEPEITGKAVGIDDDLALVVEGQPHPLRSGRIAIL